MTAIDAFILIGGKSSRMGEPKANVIFLGKRMLDRVASVIKAALPASPMLLVAANEAQVSEIDRVSEIGEVILDVGNDRGPVGGLQAAVEHSTAEWAFVCACDLPMLTAEFIEFLVEQIDEDCDVVIPIQADDFPQPLAAVYRVATVRERLRQISRNDRPPSLMNAIWGLRLKKLMFGDYKHLDDADKILMNVNSPNDVKD